MLPSLLAIAVLHWAVLIIPGVNFVLISQLAAGGSRREAMCAVGGMTIGTLAWALLAVAGVGVVFTAHPSVRLAAQSVGGLYLIYLAFKLWLASDQATASTPPVFGGLAAFRAGFTTSALNPKPALFFGSVFTTSLSANPSPTMLVLAVLLVFANSVVWHSSLALLLSRPNVQRAYLRHNRALNRLSGVLVGLYGARLIAATVSEVRSRTS
ncbi:LysE family translocator [Undibacterium sp. RuTC16W]|uniref:LysE family translocator n=1 Tax=Undibacterium sp. RuTC16W TaxID=3413048 RepID=UPI003BF26040